MQLTNADLHEFKSICKEEFGIELSDAEATEEALRLINLVKSVVASPALSIALSLR